MWFIRGLSIVCADLCANLLPGIGLLGKRSVPLRSGEQGNNGPAHHHDEKDRANGDSANLSRGNEADALLAIGRNLLVDFGFAGLPEILIDVAVVFETAIFLLNADIGLLGDQL